MNRFFIQPRCCAVLFLMLAAGVAGCNLPARDASTPTLSVTQAYQTVEARLTEALSQTSPATATEPPEATATQPPATSTVTQSQVTATTAPPAADALCDQALPGVPIDVTIPDDTQLSPGEEFTKTWRLQNAGTCTWTTGYALAWFSGEALDAPASVPLTGEVAPGGTVDLSADMKAPEAAGTYQSNWKLRNPSGTLFGIGPNGGAAFWVRIAVVQSSTTTGTPAPTVTITHTPTPTPGVEASGRATLEIDDIYDLDTNAVNAEGEDLTYQLAAEEHVLAPIGDAAFVFFGGTEPTLEECQNLTLSSDPFPIDDLTGSYLCYRTNMALPGRMHLTGFDSETAALQVEITTWAIP
jgi:hypothetical protein